MEGPRYWRRMKHETKHALPFIKLSADACSLDASPFDWNAIDAAAQTQQGWDERATDDESGDETTSNDDEDEKKDKSECSVRVPRSTYRAEVMTRADEAEKHPTTEIDNTSQVSSTDADPPVEDAETIWTPEAMNLALEPVYKKILREWAAEIEENRRDLSDFSCWSEVIIDYLRSEVDQIRTEKWILSEELGQSWCHWMACDQIRGDENWSRWDWYGRWLCDTPEEEFWMALARPKNKGEERERGDEA
jgi:hypothetical protein